MSVSLPLFSGLSRLTDVRKERFRLQRIRNENEQQRLSLYKEIDDACLSLRAAAEEHRQAVEQLRTSTVTLKESEEKGGGDDLRVRTMEKRNLYILAKAELSRTRLQYELKSRTVDFYPHRLIFRNRINTTRMAINSMDTRIERKSRFKKKHIYSLIGIAVGLLCLLWLLFRDTSSSLKVEKERITIATVQKGEFNDYIRVIGRYCRIVSSILTPSRVGASKNA